MKRGLEKLLLAPLTAIFLYSSSCSLYTLPEPTEPIKQSYVKESKEFGKTENMLEYMVKEHGLNTERIVDKNGINYNIYTTYATRQIMEKEQFDANRKKFDKEKFMAFTGNSFIEGIDHYTKNYPTPIKIVHIVLGDFGKTRNENSTMTVRNTSIIIADARRWHKYWSYDNGLMAKVIAVHEFTHVQNYSLDSDETSPGKEYAAATVECLAYIHFSSQDVFRKTYRGRMIGIVPMPDAIKYNQPNNRVKRSVIRNLFLGTLDGKYAVKEKDKVVALKNLASSALKEPTNGEEGFNLAMKAAGFTYDKKPLTLKILRDETEKEIIEWYAKRGIKP
ncbi:MAG: hypothetical protein V1906_01105 [Candidatus Woesearchaeota archaeon]